jgi:protein ImuB
MLWLCLYFPRLPAEALNLHSDLSVAVAWRGARRWLATGTAGIEAGMPLADALGLEPLLHARLRQPAAERERLRALAHAAYRYGSPVCAQIIEPHGEGQLPWPLLWVEVGQSLTIHGGLEALRDALCADLMELGTPARMALAPTRLGATLLARVGDTAPATTLDALRERLSALPLHCLPWPEELLETLRGLGLRRLGEVLALPRAEFARRVGDVWLLQLDRIVGRVAHPFQNIRPPARFERRFEFFEDVESIEGLLFPLRRLCVELQHYLRARATGVCTLRLILLHAQSMQSRLDYRYTQPTRDAIHLFDTLRERLQRLGAGAPVREIRLSADDFADPPSGQADLFGEAANTLEWQRAVDRLRARLGDAAVWSPFCAGDHRPELGWCKANMPIKAAAQLPARPAWLLRTPQRIAEPPCRVSWAERIESGWWDGGGVRRDYYCADLHAGRAWVFQDIETGLWYLHGWWA